MEVSPGTRVDFQQRAERCQVSFPAEFAWGSGLTGMGEVSNLSVSGARIEEIDTIPSVGTPVDLTLSPRPGVIAVTMTATVVRETESGGFAVMFDNPAYRHRLVRLMMLGETLAARRPGRPILN